MWTKIGGTQPLSERVKSLTRLPLCVMCFVSGPVGPASAQDLSPVTNMFNTVLGFLTGPIGLAIGTIAVIGCGYLLMMGRLHWAWFASILVGLVLIFFADDIVSALQP